MCPDDETPQSFEEIVRAIAREVSDSVERTVSQVDLDRFAETFGLDPDRARDWVDSAAGLMRAQFERMGEDAAARASDPRSDPRPDPRGPKSEPRPTADPFPTAGPHPLDLPTEEQGLALAALDSGRWTVEPGTDALASRGEGPGPSDAMGLVRELRARDWIAADGEITLVGRHALSRWLDSTTVH
jgi:hypothetical protein